MTAPGSAPDVSPGLPPDERLNRVLDRAFSIARGLAGAASLASGVAAAAWVAASKRSLPIEDGVSTVDGAGGEIEILRDRHGVPHVFAASDADALFGQGYVHAQDRLFQMDTMRRVASGRLAELVGPSAVRSDRFMRRIGLAPIASRDLEATSERDAALVHAYARGVNAGIADLPALPPEYRLLGAPPEQWSATDSFLVGRLMLFSFATNWDTELLRERLLAALGPERAAAVDPTYPAGAATATGTPNGDGAARLLDAYRAALQAGLPAGGASNAFALAGSRTESGAPLLASDPHLQARLPGLFHVTHLSGDRIDAIGADVPGVPGIAIGHNRDLAWGLTAGFADVADCYVETLHPDDPRRYLTPEGWATARIRVERILVRGAEPVEETVIETRHGPLIGDVIGDAGNGRAIALRSTTLETGDAVGPFLGIARASTVEQFNEALDGWTGTSFNFVYAHREGSIGYRLAGQVPRRDHGEGLLPADGARSTGPPPLHDVASLPRVFDPPSGAIVSANNAPGGDLNLGEEWCEPWRAERITELLDARERHDVASLGAIQFDRHSAPLLRLRERLLSCGAATDPAIRGLLEDWDGQTGADSSAAAILETVYQQLARTVAGRMAGDAAPIVLGAGLEGVSPHSSFHYRLQGWLLDHIDDPRPPAFDGLDDRDRLLRSTLARTVAALSDRLGREPRGWRWGDLHPLRLDHALRGVPGLGRWLSRGPYPYGGDVNTVNQGGYSVHDGPDSLGFVAAYRQVIDLADFDRSTYQLMTGASGIPGHPRYDDCIPEYLAGRSRPLLYSRPAIEAAVEHRLTLVERRDAA